MATLRHPAKREFLGAGAVKGMQALNAPGRCVETRCMCLGDDVCVFEMEWA